MSTRRRHFPFGGHKNPSSTNSVTSCPSSYEMGKSRFHLSLGESSFKSDTKNFISSIHQCLTSCASYTQALNTLCGAGTQFANCLVNLFQNLHPYQEIAGQFLEIWKSLSDETGSASAAVKTETLMNLQDILTRLESNEGKREGNCSPWTSAENIQILFTCLNSFIRLQALFSYSSWESLDKLSRNIDDPQSCSAVSNSHSSNAEDSHSVEAISGHFQPLPNRIQPHESSVMNASSNSYNAECSMQGDGSAVYQTMPASDISSISSSQMWNSGAVTSLNGHCRENTSLSCASSPKKSFQDTNLQVCTLASAEEIQDVLDLLSFHPDSNERTSSCPSLPDEKMPSFSDRARDNKKADLVFTHPTSSFIGLEREMHYREMIGKSTWPRTGGSVDPSTWGSMFLQNDSESVHYQIFGSSSDYLNGKIAPIDGPLQRRVFNPTSLADNIAHYNQIDGSVAPPFSLHNKQYSDLSVTSDGQTKSQSSTQGDSSSSSEEVNDLENVFSSGLNITVSDLVGSVRHRRHSSSDGLPEYEGVDMNSAFASNNNVSLESRLAKTSTWPLKQHNPRMSNQSSVFLGQETLESHVVSTNVPMWNNSSIVSSSSTYSPNLGHSEVENYSLFGGNG